MANSKERPIQILPEELKAARVEQKRRTTIERRQTALKRTIDRAVRAIRYYGTVKDPTQPMKIHEVTLTGIRVDKQIDASIYMSYLENGNLPVDKAVVEVEFSDRNSTEQKPLREKSYSLFTNRIEYETSQNMRSEVKLSDGGFDKQLLLVKQVITLAERRLRSRTAQGKE